MYFGGADEVFTKIDKHLIILFFFLLKHILPICSTGWKLMAVDSGLRVWQKNVENKPSWMPRTIYACFGIIPASQKVRIECPDRKSLTSEGQLHRFKLKQQRFLKLLFSAHA